MMTFSLFFFQIGFEAVRGKDWSSDIAIDSVKLDKGMCCKFWKVFSRHNIFCKRLLSFTLELKSNEILSLDEHFLW